MSTKNIATVKEIHLDKDKRQIKVTINAKGSIYVEEPRDIGFPTFLNSAPLVEGFNYILEHHSNAIAAMKGNKEFIELAAENKQLKKEIKDSLLADRVRQFLSSLDYEKLTPFQAKCALLLEKELK